MSYATGTIVPVERTQGEIRRILEKYHATGFAFAEQADRCIVAFQMKARMIKFTLPMGPRPSNGATEASKRTHAQICRAKWRALFLAIKSKLVNIDSGIATFEQEFMAQIVLPNGVTVGDAMKPQIDRAYVDGKMPPLLGYSP